MATEKDPPTNDFTLRARLLEILSLKDDVTNSQIVDVVAGLVKPASNFSQEKYETARTANERLRKALSTLAQVNRAQAGMLEEVFIERGVAR